MQAADTKSSYLRSMHEVLFVRCREYASESYYRQRIRLAIRLRKHLAYYMSINCRAVGRTQIETITNNWLPHIERTSSDRVIRHHFVAYLKIESSIFQKLRKRQHRWLKTEAYKVSPRNCYSSTQLITVAS